MGNTMSTKSPDSTPSVRPETDRTMHTSSDSNCGMAKTLLARKYFRLLKRHNPSLRLHLTNTYFIAYRTRTKITIIGEVRMTLHNELGYEVNSVVYVTKDQDELLLGKEEAEASSFNKP